MDEARATHPGEFNADLKARTLECTRCGEVLHVPTEAEMDEAQIAQLLGDFVITQHMHLGEPHDERRN